MDDRVLGSELERLRLARARLGWLDDNVDGGVVPAFLGQVTTVAGLIGVGKFLMVQPVSVLGAEVEGGAGQFTAQEATSVPVYLVGPARPTTGDYLICRHVDDRWAAERSSAAKAGGGTADMPDCSCSPIPAMLAMTSNDPNCNFGMFQSCTIQYGPTPPEYGDLSIGINSFLSVESFPDSIAGGATFRYLLTCSGSQFNLSRVYVESPYGSPYRDGILYSWLIGGAGNTCNPFHLDSGTPYVGSDQSCFVTIDGA